MNGVDEFEWEDPFSPAGLRHVTSKILTGDNYRLFFEGVTRRKLLKQYGILKELAHMHADDDQAWRESIERQFQTGSGADKDLCYWLIGLTKKTAENLEVKTEEGMKEAFYQLMDEIGKESGEHNNRDTALLIWCGAATLTVRGSSKSKIGKSLEKSIARTALTVLQLSEESEDFRLGIGADKEVDRETDCEIRTPRGTVKLEIGLIGKGNPEVVGDKINRVSRNSIVLVDLLSPKSIMWDNARNAGVELIQMRNGNPVEDLRRHLESLGVEVAEHSIPIDELETRIRKLPLSTFDFS